MFVLRDSIKIIGPNGKMRRNGENMYSLYGTRIKLMRKTWPPHCLAKKQEIFCYARLIRIEIKMNLNNPKKEPRTPTFNGTKCYHD